MSPGVSPEARDVDEVIDRGRSGDDVDPLRVGRRGEGIRADGYRGEHQREHSHANGEKYASHRHEDPPIRLRRGALMHRVNVLV